MQTFVDTTGTTEGLKRAFEDALAEGQAQSLLVLSCDGNEFSPDQVDPVLRDLSVPVIGGVFPLVMHGGTRLDRGNVVVAMDQCPEVYHVPGMSRADADYEDVLDRMVGEDGEFKTLLVFVDGLSKRIAAFIDALYAVFGLEVNYVGGGAGSLSLEQKPCVLTNDGLKEDAAILAAYTMESGVGVSHGWETVSGPYKVTESEGTVIKTLDWKPAFDVYREVVEEHSGDKFVALPFFDIARAYPFGIAKMGAERVVRDPLTLDGERNLVCVGEVPVGAYVDILHGRRADLIKAAGNALEKAKANFPANATPGLGLFMDCLSRVLFLEEEFDAEVEAVSMPDIEFVGACTIGEIANSGKDYLEFYNKTAVVAFLGEE